MSFKLAEKGQQRMPTSRESRPGLTGQTAKPGALPALMAAGEPTSQRALPWKQAHPGSQKTGVRPGQHQGCS